MRSVCLVIALGLAIAGWSAPVLAADVHVGINIGIPAPPPFAVPAPPRLAVVPTTPTVRYAPDLEFNFFGYGGRYYTFHDGAWFVAAEYGAPWTYVPVLEVPRPVRVVPARYYRVPPGHWHHDHGHWHDGHDGWGEEHHGHGHEHGHGHGHDDD